MFANDSNLAKPGSAHAGGRPARLYCVRVLAVISVLAWLAAVGAGLQRIWLYETTPGRSLPTPLEWPGSGLVSPEPNAATLIMFVHPRCTCTPASLLEMQAIVAQTTKPVAPWVLLLKPHGTDSEWNGNAIAELVRRVPNARLLTDQDGIEAARFGAETSGHVVLYDPAGHLLFSGGITERRGVTADNAARRAVLAALNGTASGLAKRAVLGCGLRHHEPSSS